MEEYSPPQGETAWSAPSLVNSWANVGGFEASGYRKDANGYVHLRGVVSSGAANTTVFTLPAGYRPGATEIFAQYGNNGAIDIIERVNISSAGVVTCVTNGSNFLTLSGIVFHAEG